MSRKKKISFDSKDLPSSNADAPTLEVSDLKVTFPSEDGAVHAVRGVNFSLRRGEVLGIVGESGSGKSVTSMTIMGLLDEAAKVSGSIKLHGTEILGRSDAYMSRIRGKMLSMVFQDPLSALTPVYSIGSQLVEALQVHQKMNAEQAEKRAVELLGLVGIPNPEVRFKAFPHEFSGGMRQRAMIAMAIANDPDLIICDEPTTALDVTIQAQILDLLKTAQKETGAAIIMITHDLGVVAGLADKVAVMYAGRVVESGSVDDIFYRSCMPYTIGLLGALPRPDQKSDTALPTLDGNPPSMLVKPTGCPFAPRCPLAQDKCLDGEPSLMPATAGDGKHLAACKRIDIIEENSWTYKDIYPIPENLDRNAGRRDRESRETVLEIKDLKKHFPLTKGAILKRRVGTVHAVDGISLEIKAGETVGLVGESGCGKTTTLLEILDLVAPQSGTISVLGRDTAKLNRADRKEVRKNLQVVFQDPMASLDPRMPISQILSEPLKYNGYSAKEIQERTAALMKLVGLEPAHLNRYPRHFSGGQRQRIGIARALALEPKLLVLDEPVSALDVSIQAGVINLLDSLKSQLGLSYLFVAHDLSVVRHIADRVAVMYLGTIVETGDVEEVFNAPQHPYTQALLSAIPVPDPDKEKNRKRIILKGDLPSPANPPSGCRFRTRCPLFEQLPAEKQQLCIDKSPQLEAPADSGDLLTACHYPRVQTVF